jgi:hypothetical protein
MGWQQQRQHKLRLFLFAGKPDSLFALDDPRLIEPGALLGDAPVCVLYTRES